MAIFAVRKSDLHDRINLPCSNLIQSYHFEWFNFLFNIKKTVFDHCNIFYFRGSPRTMELLDNMKSPPSGSGFILFEDKGWENEHLPVYDLKHFLQTKDLTIFNEKEDIEMFENYVITNIEFGELNPVALKKTIKDIAAGLEDVSIEKEDGVLYLVKDAEAIPIEGEEFQKQIKSYVEGKTMAELRKNPTMYKIITKLGLIKSCSIVKSEAGLNAIFGN